MYGFREICIKQLILVTFAREIEVSSSLWSDWDVFIKGRPNHTVQSFSTSPRYIP